MYLVLKCMSARQAVYSSCSYNTDVIKNVIFLHFKMQITVINLQ